MCTRIKPICQCFTFKNIKILSIEESMGVSAHDSYGYSNASPSKTLKPSVWKKAWVLVHITGDSFVTEKEIGLVDWGFVA